MFPFEITKIHPKIPRMIFPEIFQGFVNFSKVYFKKCNLFFFFQAILKESPTYCFMNFYRCVIKNTSRFSFINFFEKFSNNFLGNPPRARIAPSPSGIYHYSGNFCKKLFNDFKECPFSRIP